MPLLLIQNQSDASATPDTGGRGTTGHGAAPAQPDASATRYDADVHAKAAALTAAAATPVATTPTTAAPTATTAAAPVETTLPSQNVAAHTAVPSTTTTTDPPPPTTTTHPVAAPAPTSYQHTGQVTYYDHPAGTCASPWLAFGTVVRITNPANGESVSCVVNDREADTARSIDLATSTFSLIAPLSQGVIDAELSW